MTSGKIYTIATITDEKLKTLLIVFASRVIYGDEGALFNGFITITNKGTITFISQSNCDGGYYKACIPYF